MGNVIDRKGPGSKDGEGLDLKSLLARGVKAAKRNGEPDDPLQFKAIMLARKIAITFVSEGHYTYTKPITDVLCTMSMGPLKHKAVMGIVRALIVKKQYNVALDIALLLASFKGKFKLKATELVCLELILWGQGACVSQVLDVLESNEDVEVAKCKERLTGIGDALRSLDDRLDTFDKKDKDQISSLLQMGIEKAGVSLEDPLYIQSLLLAKTSAEFFVRHHFDTESEAIGCVFFEGAMDLFKATCLKCICDLFFQKRQFLVPFKFAKMASVLDSKAALSVCKGITETLFSLNQLKEVDFILTCLKENSSDYADELLMLFSKKMGDKDSADKDKGAGDYVSKGIDDSGAVFIENTKQLLSNKYETVYIMSSDRTDDSYMLTVTASGYTITEIHDEDEKEYVFDYKTNAYMCQNVSVNPSVLKSQQTKILADIKRDAVRYKVVDKES